MSILFIAVQCFNCSTMQVKQQKKSSNRWTCVVCNEKQSVRKILARGFQAKDVRKFVQGFNASRSASGRSDGSGWISPRPDRSDGGSGVGERGGERRRMDWGEYLDPEAEGEEREAEEERGFLSGPAVTTELPQKKFGRFFPKCPSKFPHSQASDGSTNLKPKFSRQRQNEASQGNSGSLKCQRTAIKRAPSKWSKYLDKEGEIGLKFDDDANELLDVKESMPDGFIVVDEVHPDFI